MLRGCDVAIVTARYAIRFHGPIPPVPALRRFATNDPAENRTPVPALKGPCPNR